MTRILSDLHFGHRGSRVRELGQLAPLLEGAERIVFNGDSVEMRFMEEREQALADADALRQLCVASGANPVFLTGNHDPALTDLHHLELADGAVFVTHGDILFQGISPWSIEAAALREAHRQATETLAPSADLHRQLVAIRRAALALEQMGGKFLTLQKPGVLNAITHHLWPPWRPWHILMGWARTPFLANALAAAHAPQARFVIVGHTHFSGVWRVGKRVVINTGGFVPLSSGLAVDLDDEWLIVRKIAFENGQFRLARKVASYVLDPA